MTYSGSELSVFVTAQLLCHMQHFSQLAHIAWRLDQYLNLSTCSCPSPLNGSGQYKDRIVRLGGLVQEAWSVSVGIPWFCLCIYMHWAAFESHKLDALEIILTMSNYQLFGYVATDNSSSSQKLGNPISDDNAWIISLVHVLFRQPRQVINFEVLIGVWSDISLTIQGFVFFRVKSEPLARPPTSVRLRCFCFHNGR